MHMKLYMQEIKS